VGRAKRQLWAHVLLLPLLLLPPLLLQAKCQSPHLSIVPRLLA
jgi:hypothetical protein